MITTSLSNRYKVDPYGSEEVLSEAGASAAPILTIDYGDEVQEAEFIFRQTKGALDLNIAPNAIIQSIQGNTVIVNNELVNCKLQGIKSIGFNQWDEQWEFGGIDDTTGQPAASGQKRSKNFISVIGNVDYFFKATHNLWAYAYDSNYNFIGRIISASHNNIENEVHTTPSNARFVKIKYDSSANDICINISDTSKNGTYEPYNNSILELNAPTLTGKLNGEGSSVVVFSDGMKKAGLVRDEILIDQNVIKGIKRVATRAFQEGDADSDSMTTDGVSYTNYVLDTPEEYIINNINIKKLMLGATEVTKVYIEDLIIYEKLN